uniref:CD34 n=1 Tax=Buteo japonicus TaxID=224669 RepID=A0A8B9Z201_9AVES
MEMRQRELTGRVQSSGAGLAKPSFVYGKSNKEVKSSIVLSLVPFGIKSLKRGRVRNHQDFSQKTLIALVTSGLMLAFLGLAGYFLMKRRSWSPAGERLAEDPYYTESGSQGNTMLMMSPQEQPELQEKPNLNGGTQENGTGQASSKNGHSAKQHSPADTEM